jgi:hypothetical protein
MDPTALHKLDRPRLEMTNCSQPSFRSKVADSCAYLPKLSVNCTGACATFWTSRGAIGVGNGTGAGGTKRRLRLATGGATLGDEECVKLGHGGVVLIDKPCDSPPAH